MIPVIKIHESSDYLLVTLLDSSTSICIGKIDVCKDINSNILYIASVFVNASHRKNGISKLMFDTLFERIEYMSYSKLVLDVIPINECDIDWLISYYEKIGFQLINTYTILEQSPHMEYELC